MISGNPSSFELSAWKRRRISPEAGRAIDMLAHAIEYLEDMHAHEGSLIVWEKAHLKAVEILKARNREIYEACPLVPTFDQRVSAFFRNRRH